MKKLLAILLAVLMLVGCGSTATEETEAAKVITVGAGSVTSYNETKQQWNTTYAVLMMEDGVITAVKFDVAQNTVGNDDNRTKAEKLGDYGMGSIATVGEWYEQAAALENWLIGKTAADLAAAVPAEADESGHFKSTDADLLAVCTISISDFAAAATKAADNAVEVEGAVSVGIESYTTVAESYGAVKCNTDMVALAFDANGTIVWANWDVAQNGTTAAESYPTKAEKLEAYGMKDASPIGKEWYEQAAGLEAWLVGKTPADFATAADDADLAAVCTISIDSVGEAIAKFVK